MSKIRFQILPPIAHPAETVAIIGSIPALGDWEPERGLRLEWHPPFQTGEIDADIGTHFEYKIVRGTSWESEAVDAYGDIPGNFSHEVWLDATLHHTVADWKDRFQGRLTTEVVHSRVLAGSRNLLIWLPQSYASEPTRRFPLIVLNDGANIFDPLTSPLSGVDWAADEWAAFLAHEGVMPEAIVVGICHPEGFSEENETMRDFDLSPQLGGAAYAQFLTTEFISHMDRHYRTVARPEARILGGSSLGALSAFYVAVHHPGVFGRFACLSTAFEDIAHDPPAAAGQLLALAAEPALSAEARIYFDYGTHGLDKDYDAYHSDLGTLLREKGWRDGREFKIVRVENGGHDELSWRQRLGDALRFLAQ